MCRMLWETSSNRFLRTQYFSKCYSSHANVNLVCGRWPLHGQGTFTRKWASVFSHHAFHLRFHSSCKIFTLCLNCLEAPVGAIMVSWVLELDAFVFRIMLVVAIGNWLFPPLMIFNNKLYCVKSTSSWLIESSSSSEEESWVVDFGPAFHCESKALLL
jgi:hypothetical protein